MGKRLLLGFLIIIFIATNGWQIYAHNKAKFKNDYQSHKVAFEEVAQYIRSEAEKYEGARYITIYRNPFVGYYESVRNANGKRDLDVNVEAAAIRKTLFIPLRLLRYNDISYDYSNQEVTFTAYLWEYNRAITYEFGWIYSPSHTEAQVKENQNLDLPSDEFMNAGDGWYYYKTIEDVSDNYDNEKVQAIQRKIIHTIIFLAIIYLLAAWDRVSRKEKKGHVED